MSVPTFSQLLSDYLNRSGISDSELARSIGVRRQTIFRWKEGIVERPRAREDVLRCAKKLRLAPEERDLLLLAAGFAPEELTAEVLRPTEETAVDPDVDTGSTETGSTETSSTATSDIEAPVVPATFVTTGVAPTVAAPERAKETSQGLSMGDTPVTEPDPGSRAVTATPLAASIERPATQQPVWLPLRQKIAVWGQAFVRQPFSRYAALGVLLGLVIIGGILFPRLPIPAPPDPTPTRSVIQVPLGALAGTPESSFPAIYPQAAVGETLLIVAPFRGYTPTERYNVAGRIRDALLEEIVAANLLSTTIAIWPEEIGSSVELGPVLVASDAALVIWGEYDSGRVRVNLDGQNSVTEKHDFPLSSPTELITTITSTLPKEIRMLALAVLGRLLRNQGDFAKATRAFEQAIRLQPGDPKTTARLYFYLGHMTEQTQTLTALARALRYYDAALAANPLLIDARYNRGTVNLNRSYLLAVDDPQFQAALDAAIVDLTDVITDRPGFLFAYQNRGVAHYERNGEGDQARAVADFSHIIAVDPENTRAYFHRALAQLRGDTGRSWVDDFEQSLLLNPDYYPATNGLCWGYALEEQPDVALPFCDEAVALDPTGASRDSRAIVYAQLGRYAEAVADFSAYLAWVEAMDSSTLYTRYRGPVVEEWIVQLHAGKNPFDSTLLDSLR